jgi:energy-coupling factor transport system ATP-binding protein
LEESPVVTGATELGTRHVLRFDAVSFTYRSASGDVLAVNDVSLVVRPGEAVAVLGANGSGKSTLVRMANGLALPERGVVTVDGLDTRDASRMREVRSSVGMVFQRPDDQIVATTVEDDIAFGPENLGLPRAEIRARVDEAMAAVGLEGLGRREPHLLSGGQKQRLAIAGALAMRPRYLVLDEPTSMLDTTGRAEVTACVHAAVAAGTGVLLVTHDVAEAFRCTLVVVLAGGSSVFAGTPADLIENAAELPGWGLELPHVTDLVKHLRAQGVELAAETVDPAAVVEALWA